jgi:hypothetical protein
MTPGGLADLLGAEGVRNPEGGLVPGDRQESGEEAVAVDPLEDPFLDHLVRVAAGGRKRLEEGLREVRRADVERVARWPGVIGRPRPRGTAENGERLGGAEPACQGVLGTARSPAKITRIHSWLHGGVAEENRGRRRHCSRPGSREDKR